MSIFFDKSSLITGKQAQQSFRFVLRVRGVDTALVRSVTVPKYTIETSKYSMLEYDFSYPKKVKWDGKISFDVLQIIDENIFTTTLGYFMSLLYNSNYYASPMGIGSGEKDPLLPNAVYGLKGKVENLINFGLNPGYQRNSDEGTVLEISKQKLSGVLKTVQIDTLDDKGERYDCWKLNGAFITAVSPTDLTYENETISTVKIDLSYDWASYGFRGVFAEEDSVQRLFGI